MYIKMVLFEGFSMTVAFAGHRMIFENLVRDTLAEAVQQAYNDGYTDFLVGTHGKFDSLATEICTALADKYDNVKVQIVVTSLSAANKYQQFCKLHKNVCTTMYDIEDAHYKQRIVLSNRHMADSCDLLICYVDTSRLNSGAAATLAYAKTIGKKIQNIY